MREYYDRRAPEYDDWWEGRRPVRRARAARLARRGGGAGRGAARAARPPGRSTSRAARASSRATCRARSPAWTRAPRCSRSRASGIRPAASCRATRSTRRSPTAPSSASRPVTSTATSSSRSERASSRRRGAWRRSCSSSTPRAATTSRAERMDPRVLRDGSRHAVFKRWFEPAELREELGGGEVVARAAAGSWRCSPENVESPVCTGLSDMDAGLANRRPLIEAGPGLGTELRGESVDRAHDGKGPRLR